MNVVKNGVKMIGRQAAIPQRDQVVNGKIGVPVHLLERSDVFRRDAVVA